MAVLFPLPDEPTPEMRAAFIALLTDDAYPIPTGQAALWAVLAGYSADPVAWVNQVLDLSSRLIDDEA